MGLTGTGDSGRAASGFVLATFAVFLIAAAALMMAGVESAPAQGSEADCVRAMKKAFKQAGVDKADAKAAAKAACRQVAGPPGPQGPAGGARQKRAAGPEGAKGHKGE